MKPERFLTSTPPLNSSPPETIFVWSGKERQALRIMESKSVLDPLFSKQCRFDSTFHQFVDAIGDALRGFSKLPDAPVCCVALGHVAGPGVVHQPLRE